jgi:hypothetical protein
MGQAMPELLGQVAPGELAARLAPMLAEGA